MLATARKEAIRVRELLSGCGLEVIAPRQQSDSPKIGAISRLLLQAGMSSREVVTALLRACLASVVVFLLVAARLSMPLAVVAALLPWFFLYKLIRRRVFKRAESFERDYPAMLLALASGVRTGLDPLTALLGCANLFPKSSILRGELEKLEEDLERAVPEDVALQRFAITIAHPDIQLFRSTFVLARKEGASLAQCLRRLARVTRQRQSFRRKVRSTVAMQRLSAFGIAGCAIAILLIQVMTNIDALRDAYADPLGSKALLAGGGLIAIGVVWMLQLAKTRI